MKNDIFFLFVLGLLAAFASASESDPSKNEKAGGMGSMLGPALLPVLAPSQQKVNLEKSFAKQTALALKPVTTPEQLQALEKMFNASITYEEKLLEAYTRLQNLAREMDSVTDPSEREPMSEQMRSLIEEYKNLCDERERAPVKAGLITESALDDLLAVPEIQGVKEAIKDLVLSPFSRYV